MGNYTPFDVAYTFIYCVFAVFVIWKVFTGDD